MNTHTYESILGVPLPAELKCRLKQLQKMLRGMQVYLFMCHSYGHETTTSAPHQGLTASVMALSNAIRTNLLAFKLIPLPRSFAQVLDDDLMRYEPLDKMAFRTFQQKVKNSVKMELDPKDFFDWINIEHNIIQYAQRTEKPAYSVDSRLCNSGWKFIDRVV